MLRFRIPQPGQAPDEIEVNRFSLFCDGYTGRDEAAVRRHIDELARDLGMAPPASVPTCYPMAARLALQDPGAIEVYGDRTSGEIEAVIVVQNGRPSYLTLGSDHTDRELEAHSIPKAKNLCPKVIATEAWAIEEAAGHWDALELESWSDGEPYQRASLALMLPLDRLLAAVPGDRLSEQAVIMGGTVPTLGGLRFGGRFEGALRDPVRGREIRLSYRVSVMEPIS